MDLTVTWKQINTETPQHGNFSGISVFFQELPEIPHKLDSIYGSVSFIFTVNLSHLFWFPASGKSFKFSVLICFRFFKPFSEYF